MTPSAQPEAPRSALEEQAAEERRAAARALLMRPLLGADSDHEAFTLVRRHGDAAPGPQDGRRRSPAATT